MCLVESLKVYDKLQKLLDDFAENAKTYAKLVIDEVFLFFSFVIYYFYYF